VKQLQQVVILGAVAGPLELHDVPVGEVVPQPTELRRRPVLPADDEEVTRAGEVADLHLRPDLVIERLAAAPLLFRLRHQVQHAPAASHREQPDLPFGEVELLSNGAEQFVRVRPAQPLRLGHAPALRQ